MLFTLTFWTTNLTLDLSVNTTDSLFRCMVYGNPFYISVVAPIAIILLVNIIILVMVTISLHSSSKCKPMSDAVRVISEARIAFACKVLLGKTWILVFFAVEEVTVAFQWLFCITNSLQGFFIFLFYTVRNQEVRNTWLKALEKDLLSNSSQPKMFKNTNSKDKKG